MSMFYTVLFFRKYSFRKYILHKQNDSRDGWKCHVSHIEASSNVKLVESPSQPNMAAPKEGKLQEKNYEMIQAAFVV